MNILTDSNFTETISGSKLPVLVDIYTEWCPPCKKLAPIMEKLDEEYKEKVSFCKMNLDENPETGNDLSVNVIPTVILYVNGVIKDRFTGYREEEDLKQWLNSKI